MDGVGAVLIAEYLNSMALGGVLFGRWRCTIHRRESVLRHVYALRGMPCREQAGGRVGHGSQLRGFQHGVRGDLLCMSRGIVRCLWKLRIRLLRTTLVEEDVRLCDVRLASCQNS
jgi:hypothetical protein